MTLALVKERLHDYIEQADEKKVHAIYTLIENEIGETNTVYDKGTISYFEQLREKFIDSKHPGYTIEQSMENIKRRLKK